MKTSLKPGMTLQGRYRILSLIGKGGMGFVYKVLGLRLNKEFALKEMYDHFVDPGDRERVIKQFQNEAETLARLEHLGVPRIVDTFEENERHYLVMEYVDGKNLEQVVMDNPQYMMEGQVMEWIEQILDILDYLHNRPDPIIIRDLKPANIMLGNDGKLRIIDFGIAKIFDPKDRTQTAIKGSGSAGFAPPEQYGSGGTDPRSDIYALGVTLYYLLTKVIISDSVDRILQGGDVLPPSHYNPIVSEAMDRLIQKMVELKPDDRFQNVSEIREYMESENLVSASVQPSVMKPSASSLPKTAVKMQNQEVVEEWKKRQSQVSLERGPQTAQMPQPTSMPASSGEREYHFASAALLKGKLDEKAEQEKKKKGGLPAILITGMFVGVFIFLLLCISIPYFLKAGTRQTAVNPSPSPSPSPTVVKVVEEHKNVAGKITKLEKSEDTVKMQVKTSDGPVSLSMKRSSFPKKAKIGAEVKGEYKTSGEGVTKAPWPVVSLKVTKPAPEPKQTPAYVPPAGGGGYGGGYSGGGGGGGYSGGGGGGYSGGGGGGYSGGGGGGGSSGGGGGGSSGGGGGSSGGGGGLTHGRQNY